MHLALTALQQATDKVQKVQVVAPVDLGHAAADTVQKVRLIAPVEIVRQGIDWGTWIMAGATVVLVGVTIYSYLRTQALNEKVAKLQQRHEKERREAEAKAARDRLRSVRARAAGAAYALQRQLKSWLEEAPDAVDGIVAIYDGFTQMAKAGDEFTRDLVNAAMLKGGLDWVSAHGGEHFDRAEQRVQQLLQDAPELDEQTAIAIRRAFLRFYRGTGWMNQAAVRAAAGDEIPAERIAEAFHDLEGCVTLLNDVIGQELLNIVL